MTDNLNMIPVSTEILINANQVTHKDYGDSFEFVLNMDMQVVECVRIESLLQGIITPVENPKKVLDGMLFELNHVRVNPNADNKMIIQCLTNALTDIGVKVHNSPNHDSMSMCFRPLGEISDNVRFYVDKTSSQLKFLSPAIRKTLHAIATHPTNHTKPLR